MEIFCIISQLRRIKYLPKEENPVISINVDQLEVLDRSMLLMDEKF